MAHNGAVKEVLAKLTGRLQDAEGQLASAHKHKKGAVVSEEQQGAEKRSQSRIDDYKQLLSQTEGMLRQLPPPENEMDGQLGPEGGLPPPPPPPPPQPCPLLQAAQPVLVMGSPAPSLSPSHVNPIYVQQPVPAQQQLQPVMPALAPTQPSPIVIQPRPQTQLQPAGSLIVLPVPRKPPSEDLETGRSGPGGGEADRNMSADDIKAIIEDEVDTDDHRVSASMVPPALLSMWAPLHPAVQDARMAAAVRPSWLRTRRRRLTCCRKAGNCCIHCYRDGTGTSRLAVAAAFL